MERLHRSTVGASIGAIERLRRALAAALLSASAVFLSVFPAAAMGPPAPGLVSTAGETASLPGFTADGTTGGLGERVSYNPSAPVADNAPADTVLGPFTANETTGSAAVAPGERRIQGQYDMALGTVGHLRFRADGPWNDEDPFPADGTERRGNRLAHGGLQADMTLSATDALAVMGDLYLGTVADLRDLPVPAQPFAGVDGLADDQAGLVAGTVRALWSRRLSPTSEVAVRSYLDYAEAGSPVADARLSTADLAFGHRFAIADRHRVSWGFGYGVFHHHVGTPDEPHGGNGGRTYGRFSAYLHDEITLAPDALMLTVGTGLAHDAVSGFQIQPRGRLSWRPAGRHALWASVSRSVRTPSRSVAGGAGLSATSSLASGAATPFDPDDWAGRAAEEMLAFRAGYAAPPVDGLSFDLAAFYAVYDNVRSLDFGEAETPGVLIGGFAKPNFDDEAYAGDVWGVEATAGWRATDNWTLSAGYALVAMNLRPVGDVAPTAAAGAGRVPVHEGALRSSFRLDRDLDLDISVRTVDDLADAGIGDYFEVGAELSWQPAAGVALSIVGRNLLDDSHPGLEHAIVGARSLDAESRVSAALNIVF